MTQKLFTFLTEKAQWMIVSEGESTDTIEYSFSRAAALGLIFGGRTESKRVLRRLLAHVQSDDDKQFLEIALLSHDQLQTEGLAAYYDGGLIVHYSPASPY